jgi:DNA-binding CsgD family transcriptional regulator
LALALAAGGELEEARELCHEEVRLARKFELTRALGIALTRSGSLTDGPGQPEVLREAIKVLDGTPARLAQARACFEYGNALRLRGHRAEARAPLRRALDLAIRCTAPVLAARAHAELVASGAKPRRAIISGAQALTPAEARVARLAAQRLTNREIAEALFVTEKTVEGHLAHAFRKLDIKSRAQLANVIDAA